MCSPTVLKPWTPVSSHALYQRTYKTNPIGKDKDLNRVQVDIPVYKIHSWTVGCWCDKGSNWYWSYGKETGWADVCGLKPERL